MDGNGSPKGHYSKGERRRAEIVHAAFEAFGRLGYRNASLVQIAAECGVSRAGLIHYFSTKEALLGAVLEERDRVNGEVFFAGLDASADGLGFFARLARLIEHNASIPGVVRLFALLSTEASDPDHPAHEYFLHRYQWLRRDVRSALQSLREQGLLRPGVDPDGMESELIALIDGLQIQWLLDPAAVEMAQLFRRRVGEIITLELPSSELPSKSALKKP